MSDVTATQGLQDFNSLSQDPVMGGSSLPDFSNTSTSDLFGGSTYDPLTGSGTFGGSSLPPGYDPVTGQTTAPTGLGSGSGSSLPPSYDPVTGQYNVTDPLSSLNLGNLLSTVAGATKNPTGGGSGSSALSNFLSGNPANGGLSGLAPYLATGAIGITMAKQAQDQATQEANQLQALGQPYTDAGKQLLQQYQSGVLRPDQQAVVDTANSSAAILDKNATPLQQIAQQAFSDYNSGKLPAADELQLSNQVAAQKQQVKQQLSNAGISDSSILDAQNQQIDNQAMITRQNLLDQRFATGNQAYDRWLTTTTEGQQLRLQGQEFASQSFEQMLNNSLGLAQTGMQPAMEAIQLKIQSDAQLSQTVSELLGNLASAYSYAAAGPKTVVNAGGGGVAGGTTGSSSGGGGGGGGSGTNISQIISGVGSLASTVGTVGKLFGFSGASGQATTGTGTSPAGTAGSTFANTVGGIADVAGIYTGIQKGGVQGYGTAAIDASNLANIAGIGNAVTGALGDLAAPLAVYNFATNWQSGATGSDTLNGAEAGAAIGSVVPVLGTAVGAIVGAVVGAISSIFGPGKESAGHQAWTQYSAQVPKNTPGRQVPTKPFEEALFGAWQDNQKAFDTFSKLDPYHDKHGGSAEGYKSWLEDTLAQATVSGKIKPGMTSQQVFGVVVAPAMDAYWKSTGSKMTMAQWSNPSVASPYLYPMMVQLTDRALSGQAIGRGSESDYAGDGYKPIPTLGQDVQQLQGSGGQKTTQPISGATA